MPSLADHAPPPHRTQHWEVRKPAARGRGGVVVCQARAAAEAGAEVLRAGGNAADAAVAAAYALAAAEPWNSGLGGIGFAVVQRRPGEAASVVDFGPVAPGGLDPSAFPLTGRTRRDFFTWPEVEGDRNVHGPLSFVVPSAVAGYEALRERFGSGMPARDLLGPAVALARRGLPQDWFTLLKVANSASVLRLYPESARLYLPGGLPPVPPYQGSPGFLPLGRLADTLDRLREAGPRDFYEGAVADALVADARAMGGALTADDLRGCRAEVRPATAIPWRGGRATVQAAGGLTAAPTLARVAEAMADAPHGAAPDGPWFRALVAALRAAYAERLAGLGAATAPAVPEPADACTTHITAADRDGMLVAVTTTLLSSMGSRVVLPATGVLMNNGVMWFDPRPGAPNAIRPGARPLCNMCPVVAEAADGSLRMAAGASGGRRILASVVQTLAFALDFGMDAEAAAHAPRLDVSGPEGATADARTPPEVLDALRADGVPVEVVEHGVLPVNFACPNHVRVARDGEAVGASDAMSPWSAAVAA